MRTFHRRARTGDFGEGPLAVLYDGDCGFCKVMLAVLLRWDGRGRLKPVPIQSMHGEELLVEMMPQERLASWHVIDGDGVRRSGGAGIPLVLAALPGGAPIGRIAARFPGATSRAYDWVAAHRGSLARPLGARQRAWGARVVAERERSRG